MVIPKGYKQTEVGVIPEDWDIVTLNSVASFWGGGTPSKSKPEYWKGFIPWISSSDVNDDSTHGIHMTRFISKQAVQESATRLCPKGTILIVSRVGVGKISIAPTELCTSQDFTNVIIQQGNVEYVARALQPILHNMANATQGTSIKGITTDEVRNIPIAFPPIEEQRKISDAILNIECFNAALEKLLAKKKAIKQGAMQELLTGKRRLPGFTGEWEKINLMAESRVKARIGWQGLKKSEYLDNGYAILVTGTDFENGRISWETCHYVDKSRYELDKNIQIKNGDILITKDGSLGKTAIVHGLTKPATLNSGVFVVRPVQNSYSPEFVYNILSSFVFKEFLDKLSAGSTIVHLYQKDLSYFDFEVPPTIEEQQAIASVLSAMDDEITELEQKLAKYRQVKQGMMQQLLTGKIRLT